MKNLIGEICITVMLAMVLIMLIVIVWQGVR